MSWKVAPSPAWKAAAGSNGVTPSLFWTQTSTKLCWFPQPQAPAVLGNWLTALLLTETDRSSWFGLLVFLPQSVKAADQLLAQPVGREWLLGTISLCSQELTGAHRRQELALGLGCWKSHTAIREAYSSWEPLALSLSSEDIFALFFWLTHNYRIEVGFVLWDKYLLRSHCCFLYLQYMLSSCRNMWSLLLIVYQIVASSWKLLCYQSTKCAVNCCPVVTTKYEASIEVWSYLSCCPPPCERDLVLKSP